MGGSDSKSDRQHDGLAQYCYNEGYAAGQPSAEPSPELDGIKAAPCTINDKVARAYGQVSLTVVAKTQKRSSVRPRTNLPQAPREQTHSVAANAPTTASMLDVAEKNQITAGFAEIFIVEYGASNMTTMTAAELSAQDAEINARFEPTMLRLQTERSQLSIEYARLRRAGSDIPAEIPTRIAAINDELIVQLREKEATMLAMIPED